MLASRTMSESRNNLFYFLNQPLGFSCLVDPDTSQLTFSLGDSGKSCTENLTISRWWVIEVLPEAA